MAGAALLSRLGGALLFALLCAGTTLAESIDANAAQPQETIMDRLEQPARIPALVKEFDKDKDGKISIEELTKLMEERFTLEDDFCSQSSHGVKRCVKRRLTPRHPRVTDRDGDGLISGSELQYSEVSMFLVLDTDKDLHLSGEELQACASFLQKDAQRFVDEYDEDGNGQIEWGEVPKLSAMFMEMDLDCDGYLGLDELMAYLSADPKLSPKQRKLMSLGMLKKKDKDGDDRLTWWEFREGIPADKKKDDKDEASADKKDEL